MLKTERRFMKLVLATKNPGKLRELQDMLDGIGIEIISAAAAGVYEDVEEDGKTLEQNALKKARTIRDIVHLPTVADDTGLFINALDGRPGIYSARWAGEGANEETMIKHTLDQMKNIPEGKRNAYFQTAAALVLDNEVEVVFFGTIKGEITLEPRGILRPKLPYDLLFIPEGYNKTFSEMLDEEKNKFSHRGLAFEKLKEYLKQV